MKKKALGLMMAAFVAALPVFVNAEEGSVKIGTTTYPTLKEAVEAVEVCEEETCATTTITVLEDHETSGIKFQSGKYIEIDLDGFTVSFKAPTVGSKGTGTQDMQILKDSTIVIKNGKLVSSDTESSKMFIQNYANLTLKDVEIDATNEQNLYALSNNSGIVSIEGTTSIKAKKVAFDLYGWYTYYPEGAQVTVNTTGTIEGTIEVTADKGTATKELSLVIENINHIGEFSIQEGLEKNVTIKKGTYTDEVAAAEVELEEGSNVYEVETTEGEIKYVVATEEDVVESAYEVGEPETGEDFLAELEEIKEELAKVTEEELEAMPADEKAAYEAVAKLVNEIEKELAGKNIASIHDIYYGSFIGENYVANSDQTELDEAVEVTLDILETVEKVKDGYTRTYSVIGLHVNENGTIEIEKLDAKDNGDGTVTFETDKFSTYVLAYEDTKIATNPNTFDGISLYMIIAGVSLISLVSIIAYSKKAKNY